MLSGSACPLTYIRAVQWHPRTPESPESSVGCSPTDEVKSCFPWEQPGQMTLQLHSHHAEHHLQRPCDSNFPWLHREPWLVKRPLAWALEFYPLSHRNIYGINLAIFTEHRCLWNKRTTRCLLTIYFPEQERAREGEWEGGRAREKRRGREGEKERHWEGVASDLWISGLQ